MVAACVTALGIALVSLAMNIPEIRPFVYCGMILTGVGAAPLLLCWRECSEHLTSKNVQLGVFSISLVLCVMLYLMIFSLPFIIALTICVLSPIISALLFIQTARSFTENSKTGVTTSNASTSPSPSPNTSDAYTSGNPKTGKVQTTFPSEASQKYFITLLICCFFLALLQSVFRTRLTSGDTGISWGLMLSSAALVTIAVVATELFLIQKLTQGVPSRLFLPIMTIVFLFCAFILSDVIAVGHFFFFTGSFLIMVLLYSEIDAIGVRKPLVFTAFIIGICVMNLGSMAGIALVALVKNAALFQFLGVVIFASCLIACIYRAVIDATGQNERFVLVRASDGDSEFHIFVKPESLTLLDSISQQCHLAAQTYALSSREEEVLRYLVRGKSAKSIAKETYISYNTVKTHVSHIYKKFDVHTHEELIQVVEDSSFQPTQ
jgi:DNA-binding CsgD family transcriptional regulator